MSRALVPAERGHIAQTVSAEIDVQIATAHAYPRDVANFEKRAIALSCSSVETARSMTYELPSRKKDANGKEEKPITGKSVKLADLLAPLYGNLRVKIASQEPGFADRMASATAMACDLETNYAIEITKHRRITTRGGDRFSDDMVAMTLAAAGAIAKRDAVFAVISSDSLDRIYKACQQKALGDLSAIKTYISMAFAFFSSDKGGKLTMEEMCMLVDKTDPETLTLEDIRSLGGFKQAIEDGVLDVATLQARARGLELNVEDLTGEGTTVKTENDSVHSSKKPKPPVEEQAAESEGGATLFDEKPKDEDKPKESKSEKKTAKS